MVTSSFQSSTQGVKDWLIQRVTSVILALYFIFLFGFFLFHPQLSFETWKHFFSLTIVRIFTLFALIALIGHAWVGVWTIITDYFTKRIIGSKATFVSLSLQGFFICLLLAYLVWGIWIIWG